MNITYNSPIPHTTKLGDIKNGEVFRFPDRKTPCVRIPLDGNEVFSAYHFYYDIEDAIDECVISHEEGLYEWDKNQEHLEYELYQRDEVLKNLLAYACLDTGKVCVSHLDERVVPMKANLVVEDMKK